MIRAWIFLGIKREDLLFRLRDCFVASNIFAPMFYDLVMEKLSTTTDDIKVCGSRCLCMRVVSVSNVTILYSCKPLVYI